jgi:hypothetical protein
MSGSINALMTPTLPGITMPPVTNTLAPPTLPGAGTPTASPTTGATGVPGQPGQALASAFTPQQLGALQALWQQQQALQAQQQAAQAQADQVQQGNWQNAQNQGWPPSDVGHGSEGSH